MQTAKDLVLDLELGAHGELGTLLDLEWVVLEGRLAALLREVDGHGVTAVRVHGEGEDDANAGIGGVGDIFAAAETEGFLVALERLITGIWETSYQSIMQR